MIASNLTFKHHEVIPTNRKLLTLRRVRRVKCDEEKPRCQRCAKSGRKCDGYLDVEVNLSGRDLAVVARQQSVVGPLADFLARTTVTTNANNNSYKKRPVPKMVGPLSRALTMFPSRTGRPGDAMLFDLFRAETAPASAHFMPSQFWTQELLQLAHSEPSIWHATITLAALHRRWDAAEGPKTRGSFGFSTSGTQHDEALALTHLAERNYARSLALTRDMTNSSSALALSLALSSATNLMGRPRESRMHLMAGRRILKTDKQMAQTMRAAGMLLRLDLEAMAFSDEQAPYEYEDTEALRRLGFREFTRAPCYASAATALFSIMRTVLLSDEVPIMTAEEVGSSPSLTDTSFLSDVRIWEETMAALEEKNPPATDDKLLASMSLRMYHAILRLFMLGDPNSWPQTRLDAHLRLFTRMLTLAEAIVRRQKRTSATMTLEPGVIFILWIIGAKCRHPRVRRRSCKLLETLRRQEGICRSNAFASLIRRLLRIEEGENFELNEANFSPVSSPGDVSEDIQAEEEKLEVEMALPWSVWTFDPWLVHVPCYETWEDVYKIPPESARVKDFNPAVSTAERFMTVKMTLSSDDPAQPGPSWEEVIKFDFERVDEKHGVPVVFDLGDGLTIS